jgi:histidyl-tRNA synthetase
LASGGRYDYLAKMLLGKELPGVGIAIGVDRIILALNEKRMLHQHKRTSKVFFIQIGAAAKRKSLSIIEMFRKANIPLAQSVSKDSLKSQLKIAQKLETPYIIILGQKEALEDTIIVRNANLGSQEIIPFSKVIDYVKEKLKKHD